MKNKHFLMNYLSVVFILLFFFAPDLKAEDPIVRINKPASGSRDSSPTDSVGNYIAVQTGQVRDGEQIPLPTYQDGKQATRKEVHYMVSPAEVPTSMTYITNQASGTFYIKCDADSEGVVHISLWQQSGTGQGTEVVSSDSYRVVKENFNRAGITNAEGKEGADNVVTEQMKALSQRLIANYMVIAVRSPKNTG
jgi:hypothetical protein